MKVTLEHPFFENRAATHSQLEEIKEKQEKAEASLNRLEEGQAEIIKMSAVTQQLVKNVVVIQKVARCYNARHHFRQTKKLAKFLQSMFRRFKAVQRLNWLRTSLMIEAEMRVHHAFRNREIIAVKKMEATAAQKMEEWRMEREKAAEKAAVESKGDLSPEEERALQIKLQDRESQAEALRASNQVGP